MSREDNKGKKKVAQTKPTLKEEINQALPLIDTCLKCDKQTAHLATTRIGEDRDRVIGRYECICGKSYGYEAWMPWLLKLYADKIEKIEGSIEYWRTAN